MTTLDIRQLAERGGVNPIAPVTVPEAVKFEDGADLTTAIGSIATIETSPATATHAVGDYIVWNGQLYEVTAVIEVGQALTPGTNISATNAGAELSALKNGLTTLTAVEVPISNVLTIASGISITNSYCYKVGKLVGIKMLLARASSTSHDSAIGTLKSGFVPTGTSYSIAMGYATGADAGIAGMVTIGSGGISIQHLPNKPYVVIDTTFLVAE